MYAVAIDGFEKKDFGRTYFRIRVMHSDSRDDPWWVMRRYSEFVTLRNSLEVLHPHRMIPDLPSNTILSYFAGNEFHSERADGLARFLRVVLQEIEPDPKSACLRDFLKIYRPCAPGVSLRDTSLGIQSGADDSRFSEDLLQQTLGFLDALDIVRLSRVSRVWYFASLSPNLWKRIRLVSARFERVQRGFFSLVDRLSSEAPGTLDSIDLHVQYSSRESFNVRMSLPENTLFHRLRSLEFSALHTASDDQNSSESLLVEIFESIISNPDTVCLSSVSITASLNSEILRSLLSIVTFNPLTHMKLVFLKANMTNEQYSLLISLIERSASTLETLEVRVSYTDSSLGAVPDNFGGERTSSYSANESFMNLLPRMTRLTKLHYDFFPKNFANFDTDLLTLPPNLQDLDIRFVVPAIGDGHDLSIPDRRSLLLEVFRAVPSSVRKIRLRTVGVDETEMMNQTEFIPYMFSSPQATFDILLPQLILAWKEKFTRLESLELEGPQLVHIGFWRFVLQSEANIQGFCAVFPRLQKLVIINSIYEFSENFVAQIIMSLGRLQVLELGGVNEKLTDNFLLKLVDRTRDNDFYARVWCSSFRSLTLPMTRYMSSIGLAAIQHVLSVNKQVNVTLEDSGRITGRDMVVDEMKNKNAAFKFTRF